MAEFVKVGDADAVRDNSMASFPVGTDRIAVARTGERLHAFDDTCTHAFCSLSDGDLEGETVVCPCHLGIFDLNTGEVLDGPPPEPIRVYPVKEVDGALLIEV